MPARATETLRCAHRWFWIMVLIAVVAMGALYQALRADPAPTVAVLFLLSALVLLASVAQASRIWVALAGPARLPRRRGRGRAAANLETATSPLRRGPRLRRRGGYPCDAAGHHHR